MNMNARDVVSCILKINRKSEQKYKTLPHCFNPIFPAHSSGGIIGNRPPGRDEVCHKCLACGESGCIVGSKYAKGGIDDESCDRWPLIELIEWMRAQSCRVNKVIENYLTEAKNKQHKSCASLRSDEEEVLVLIDLCDYEVMELYKKCKYIRRGLSGDIDR